MNAEATKQRAEVVVEAASLGTPTDAAQSSLGPIRLRHRERLSTKMKHRLIGAASVVGLLILWQVMADTNLVNATLSSSPSDVWDTARHMVSDGTLGSAVAASAVLYGAGLGLSIIIGIVAGVILGWWRLLGATFDPWIAMLYATPLIAIMPLILVWFGISFKGQVVMVTTVSVFPLLVNVMAGTRQVDPGLLRLAKSFRGSQLVILRTLVLPSIVPNIVIGLRQATAAGLIGITIAEYFEGDNGIGGLILQGGTELNAAIVFVGICVLAGASLTMTAIIRTFEGRVSGWREDA